MAAKWWPNTTQRWVGHEVAPVVQALGWRGAGGIRGQHLGGDPRGVEAVAEEVDADRRRDDPQRVDGLVALERDAADGERRNDRQPNAQNSSTHG